MDDLRIVCDESQDGVPGHGTNEFMVRNDSRIQKVEDLKGKVLATNAMGSAVDIAMRAMLREHGLEANKDYTIVEAPFPAMRAVLAEKKVDLISAVPPFSLDPDLRAMARTLFTQKDAFGTTQLTIWTARTGFIAKNRAALVDFMEDTLRAIRWYTDPANHAEAVAIVARLNKAPPARLDWAFGTRDQYRDPNGMPNLGALQSNLAETEAGRLPQGRYRRQEIFRSQHCRRSSTAPQVTMRRRAAFTASLSAHEQGEQDDDWDRHAKQPEQNSATHDVLL